MPKLWEACITLVILIAVLAVGIMYYEVDPHVPMFVGVCAAASCFLSDYWVVALPGE